MTDEPEIPKTVPLTDAEKIKQWQEKNKVKKLKTAISGSPQMVGESKKNKFLEKEKKKMELLTKGE